MESAIPLHTFPAPPAPHELYCEGFECAIASAGSTVNKRWIGRAPPWVYLLVIAAIFGTTALAELTMGRLPICKCGTVKLWAAVNTPELSQQLADSYCFSHLIHGLVLYGVLHVVNRGKWPLATCLILALVAEASWEILENSNFIIERYRHSTLSLDYFGDSILNSMSDMLLCGVGFVLAAYIPAWLSVVLIVAMELIVGYAIRDNLTLNIIMLIHPSEAIKHWQMARGY